MSCAKQGEASRALVNARSAIREGVAIVGMVRGSVTSNNARPSGLPYHTAMDSKEIRHQNLLFLLNRYRTQREFAEALSVSDQRIGHLIKGKPIGDATARQIEQLHDLPPGWMDVSHGTCDTESPDAPLSLSSDQRQLLANYGRMSPTYQALAREAVAAFVTLEQSRLARALLQPLSPES